jgi:MFS family permease
LPDTPPRRVKTDIPARLDRLPWDRFHWLVIVALGITWILDGLEVTLVGSLAAAINESPALALSPTQIGLSASAYVAGAVAGALFFGRLTDQLGRKKLFSVTVGVYAAATVLTGFSWDFWSFALFRFLTGAGIGGEYAAINSAIQEFVPARWRGFVDLAVNGSFWLGAALGSLSAIVVLDPSLFDPDTGWRVAFIVGGLLACIVIYLRRFLPESPRWLLTHDQPEKAAEVIAEVEAAVCLRRNIQLPLHGLPTLTVRTDFHATLGIVGRSLFVEHRRRAILGIVLMTTQAFCYNAVFFTYALMLTTFYGIPAADVGWFILPFALGNLMGPLLLGRLFDTVGRIPMIAGTYAISGLLLILTGYLFVDGQLSATAQTVVWTIIFFFASAGASAAYLTVGECFPLETRGLAIAIFYALGTAVGGISGPAIFGALIETGEREGILWGYLIAGGMMLAAAVCEVILGVAAEGRSLEDVARPLSVDGRS